MADFPASNRPPRHLARYLSQFSRFCLGAAALCVVTGSGVTPVHAQRTAPPRDLQNVGGHWTAWQPPSTFPEGAQVYVIESGDTLWALAQRFYGNPYLWPQVWELNQYIRDAHWIYPGDPLVVGIAVMTPEEVAQAQLEEEGEIGGGEQGPGEELSTPASENVFGILSLDEALGDLDPLGLSSDIYCAGYVGETDEDFGYSIIGSEHDVQAPQVGALADRGNVASEGLYGALESTRFALSEGDIVYVDGGRAAGLAVGQRFAIVQPKEVVDHPRTRQIFGRYYGYQGQLRVLSVQETTAIAEIYQACDSVFIGDFLKPYEEEPVPVGQVGDPRPPNYPTAAGVLADAPIILHSKDGVVGLGQNHVVFVDRGEDELLPGDIYTVYRENVNGLPPVVLGELAILSVHPRSAVARILESRYPIYLGDLLELK